MDHPPLHWSANYVGLSYSDLPNECWRGLIRDVYRAELGVSLPKHSAGDGWTKIDAAKARDFDLALFMHGNVPEHVGLVAGRPWQMLHLPQRPRKDEDDLRAASVIQRFDTGEFLPRLAGVYRWNGVEATGAPATSARGPAGMAGRPNGEKEISIFGLAFINPSEDVSRFEVAAGRSLAELVRIAFPDATEAQRARMRVTVGRDDIPIEDWVEYAPELRRVIPHPGMLVAIAPLPGWSIGRILALIAVTAAVATGQFYLGPLLAAAAGFTAGSVGAAVITAATPAGHGRAAARLATARIPPPDSGKSGDKERFTATGWRNDMRRWQSTPLVLGTRRLAPPHGATPFLQVDDLFNPGEGEARLISLFNLGDGELELPTDEMMIGETKLYKPEDEWADPDVPEFNFTGVRIEINPGTGADPAHTIYDHQVAAADGMGVQLEYSDVEVVRAAPRDAEIVETVLGFPQGLYTPNNSGGSLEVVQVTIGRSYRKIGDPAWIDLEPIIARNDTDQPYFISSKFAPPTRGDHEVKLVITDTDNFNDDFGDFERNRIVWVALYAHRPEYPLNFTRPKATIAIEIKGSKQLQGILDSFSLVAKRKALDWNGSAWVFRTTSNPGSLARWLAQHATLKPYADDRMVLDEFEELAAFCTAKGLEYDNVIESARPFPELLGEILAAGRAKRRRDGTRLGLVIDKPRTQVFGHITPRNGFEISTRRERVDRIDGFIVPFPDRTSKWEPKQRRVVFFKPEDEWSNPAVPEYLAAPTRFVGLDLPGKTNPDEIWREAKRRELELTYRAKRPSISAAIGWEGMAVRDGDMVIADSGVDRTLQSAHVVLVAGNSASLDEAVEMVEGQSYQLRYRRVPLSASETADSPPAVSVVRDLVTVPGKSKTVVFAAAGLDPEPGNLAIFGLAGSTGREMIVSRLESGDHRTARLTLIPHAPEIDSKLDAFVIPDWDGRVGDIGGGGGVLPAPTLSLVEMRFAIVRGYLVGTARVVWVDPGIGGVFSYQLRWRQVGAGASSTVTSPLGATFIDTLSLDPAGSYEVSLRVAFGGEWSAWTPVPNATLLLADADTYLLADADTYLKAA